MTFKDSILEKRSKYLTWIAILTVLLLIPATRMHLGTDYGDLSPTNHPFIDLDQRIVDEHMKGNNKIIILVEVKDREDGGVYDDIFNVETLQIVQDITREIKNPKKFPAIDSYKVMSLATDKTKKITIRAGGMHIAPVMFPDIPQTESELQDFKRMCYGNPICYPVLISLCSQKTWVMADYFPDKVSYPDAYRRLRELRERYEAAHPNHIIAIQGQPMQMGYLDALKYEVPKLLLYGAIGLLVLFFLFFRSIAGAVIPIVALFVSLSWGMGIYGVFNSSINIGAIPVLFAIALMAVTHAVFIMKRFRDEAADCDGATATARSVMNSLFGTGIAGVIIDALAVLVIVVAPIPVFHKLGLTMIAWAVINIVVSMILVPILLTYWPLKPSRAKDGRWLRGIGRWASGWGKWVMALVVLALLGQATNLGKIPMNNPLPGSDYLWPWHRYNVDAFRVAFAQGTVYPVWVLLEGQNSKDGVQVDVVQELDRFMRHMKAIPDMKIVAVLSHLGQLAMRNSAIRDGDPNWEFIPDDQGKVANLYGSMVNMAKPGAYAAYTDDDDKTMNIILLCRGGGPDIVDDVFARLQDYFRNHSIFAVGNPPVTRSGMDAMVSRMFREPAEAFPPRQAPEGVPEMKWRFAGGKVAVQKAINDEMQVYFPAVLWFALGIVAIAALVYFRSVTATVALVICLAIPCFMAAGDMLRQKPEAIGLAPTLLPVMVLGIGLCASWYIYLLRRIGESVRGGSALRDAISGAVGSVGKAAVVITISCLLALTIVWVLPPMVPVAVNTHMMFMSMFGTVLTRIMLYNMLGVILFMPALVALLKPRGIAKIKP